MFFIQKVPLLDLRTLCFYAKGSFTRHGYMYYDFVYVEDPVPRSGYIFPEGHFVWPCTMFLIRKVPLLDLDFMILSGRFPFLCGRFRYLIWILCFYPEGSLLDLVTMYLSGRFRKLILDSMFLSVRFRYLIWILCIPIFYFFLI
jgi:hypothetical protein